VPQTPTAAVGANVRAEMARRKVSQQQIAAALNLSQAAISKRLAGVVPWDVNELVTVATALEVPLSTLLDTSEAVA